MPMYGSPSRATAFQRTYAARKIQRGYRMKRTGGARRIGSTQLIRSAIASRVNVFKRTTEAFGMKAGITGTTTERLQNTGTSPNQLLAIANVSGSQFVAGSYQHGGAFQFMLAHLTNVSEITQLYDNYRIKMVYINVIPSFNSADIASLGTGLSTAIPTMHYTLDNDDGLPPANRQDVLQNSYCKSVRLDRPFTIAVKPRAQSAVAANIQQGGGGFLPGLAAGGMLPTQTWLDTASPAIPHYGIKYWMDEWPTVATDGPSCPFVKYTCTYILEAKNVV